MLDCVSQLSSADLAWEHVHNPRVDANQPYPAALRHILDFQGFLAAKQVVEALPLYVRTPMHQLRGLAGALGSARSSSRMKALASDYALSKASAGPTPFIGCCERAPINWE